MYRLIPLMTVILIIIFIVEGCAPVLVGGLILHSSKSKTERNKFLSDLNKLNLEREKAGLEPLDKCIEMYHFDPGWAASKADCKYKIDSLRKAGIAPDSTKLSKE